MKLFLDVLSTISDIEILSEVNGEKGFELIKENDADLIILDIQLPGMTGIEICQELRKLDKFKDESAR